MLYFTKSLVDTDGGLNLILEFYLRLHWKYGNKRLDAPMLRQSTKKWSKYKEIFKWLWRLDPTGIHAALCFRKFSNPRATLHLYRPLHQRNLRHGQEHHVDTIYPGNSLQQTQKFVQCIKHTVAHGFNFRITGTCQDSNRLQIVHSRTIGMFYACCDFSQWM